MTGQKENWSPATLASRYRRRRQGHQQQQLTHSILNSNSNNNNSSSSSSSNRISMTFDRKDGREHDPMLLRSSSLAWHTYLPLAYNMVLLLPLVYILFFLVYMFHHDFQMKTKAHQAAILQDVLTCGKNYEINQCHPSTRVPALEAQCQAWEICASQNPTMISRSVILGEMMGEALNSFIDPISFKAVIFYSILVMLLVVSNLRWFSHARLSSR
ncbi:Di-sulfide bridge nucleocytoplasmic transport domain-containing protein [Dichotomocladium elegans]|nr:Di-sulfide bridge nucleocytoplasmic transport domain-containing protein [Dichotomocladium elegans]